MQVLHRHDHSASPVLRDDLEAQLVATNTSKAPDHNEWVTMAWLATEIAALLIPGFLDDMALAGIRGALAGGALFDEEPAPINMNDPLWGGLPGLVRMYEGQDLSNPDVAHDFFKKIGKSIKKGYKSLGKALKSGVNMVASSGLMSALPIPGAPLIGAAAAALTAPKEKKNPKYLEYPTYQVSGQVNPELYYPNEYGQGTLASSNHVVSSPNVTNMWTPTAPSAAGQSIIKPYNQVASTYGLSENERLIALLRNEPVLSGYVMEFLRMVVSAAQGQSKQDVSPLPRTAHECVGCGTRLNDFAGDLPAGKFYESRLLTAELVDMPQGSFGEIELKGMPFKLRVSSRSGSGRGAIAFAHELAHLFDKVLKLGLSHQQVHSLGVAWATEGFPAFQAYLRVVEKPR